MKWQRQYWGGITGSIWFLRTDSGDTTGFVNPINKVRLNVDEDNIWLSMNASTTLHTTGGGTLSEFVTKINMQGDLVWQKMVGSTLVGTGSLLWIGALDEYCGIYNGEFIYSGLIDDAGTDRWRIGTLTSAGATSLEVDSGHPNPTHSNRPCQAHQVCSNGDLWQVVIRATDDVYVTLYDYSGSYLSTLYEQKIDAFGDTSTNSRIEAMGSALMSDDTLVLVGEDGGSPAKIVVVKITTGGTISAVDFYQLNDTGDDCLMIMCCTDGNDNIYVFWEQEDNSAGTDEFLVTKLNSSLVHQWTVSLDDDIGKNYNGNVLSSKASIAASPDDNRLYICVTASNVGGDLDDPTKIVALNTSDGSKHDEWNITVQNATSSEAIPGACEIACNSKDVFLGMHWRNSNNYEAGYGLIRCPQHYWDKKRIQIDQFRKSESNQVTVASATAATVASKTVNVAALSRTQATCTDLTTDDSDTLTRTFTQAPIWKAVY